MKLNNKMKNFLDYSLQNFILNYSHYMINTNDFWEQKKLISYKQEFNFHEQ